MLGHERERDTVEHLFCVHISFYLSRDLPDIDRIFKRVAKYKLSSRVVFVSGRVVVVAFVAILWSNN